MSEQHSDERRVNGISIPVPWSKEPVKVRGLGTILTLSLVCLALISYMTWEIKKDMSDEHLKLTNHIGKLEEAMVEQTYVLSLRQEDREKLNIAMPASLRKKIRTRDGD